MPKNADFNFKVENMRYSSPVKEDILQQISRGLLLMIVFDCHNRLICALKFA